MISNFGNAAWELNEEADAAHVIQQEAASAIGTEVSSCFSKLGNYFPLSSTVYSSRFAPVAPLEETCACVCVPTSEPRLNCKLHSKIITQLDTSITAVHGLASNAHAESRHVFFSLESQYATICTKVMATRRRWKTKINLVSHTKE